VNAIALFTAATEQFAAVNVGTSIAGTFERFEPIAVAVRERGLWLRGYVSVAFGCPYAGAVRAEDVLPVAERLLSLGCDEICLADTIGTATPDLVRQMLTAARRNLPFDRLALHFHDTSGAALSNVDEALEHGIRIFDAAAGGLGGCPFAPGAPGNLGTERLVDHLHGRGARTGVDVEAIAAAIALVAPYLSRQQPSPA
jgi:isopropylmalate/homocitrate/citramalate synthase